MRTGRIRTRGVRVHGVRYDSIKAAAVAMGCATDRIRGELRPPAPRRWIAALASALGTLWGMRP